MVSPLRQGVLDSGCLVGEESLAKFDPIPLDHLEVHLSYGCINLLAPQCIEGLNGGQSFDKVSGELYPQA